MDTTQNVQNISGKKILLVEDDQFLREFYQELFTGEGYEVDPASDGETAFNKISQGGYDLILLDIMLPKKDGIEILKEIKLKPPVKPNGPIVALTNLGQDSIIKKCKELGAVGYLVKSSMNPDQVLAEVKKYLEAAKV